MTEEDVRTKIVYTWLRDHCIDPSQIHLEYSFEVPVGRSAIRVDSRRESGRTPRTLRPRADLLVKNSAGKNLFIVEVKGPDEALDQPAKQQAGSYARLLPDMPPFFIVTNGHDTQIFDTLTFDPIEGESIPVDHCHVQNGFRVSCTDLGLRSEALQTLLSLSPENLLAFCEAQVAFRMRRLRGEDPGSGKKYIPALYVQREKADAELRRLLADKARRVVVLTGLPQAGKTNFVCHSVEDRLSRGEPTLFYPAIGLVGGLISAIAEDFEWMLNESGASTQQIYHRLARIPQSTGSRLTIFVDGWNEASREMAYVIDADSERLASDAVQLVVSFTHSASRRLLCDVAGNPSFLAEAASITPEGVKYLQMTPEIDHSKRLWSVISLRGYDDNECRSVYAKYAQHFKVVVPRMHERSNDPYVISMALRAYKDSTLPMTLDEPSLLAELISDKIDRAAQKVALDIPVFLRSLADLACIGDIPVNRADLLKALNAPLDQALPDVLFEAALVSELTREQYIPALDFYYDRERDFVISYWARGWTDRSLTQTDRNTEFELANRTNAGRSALHWFLRQPSHIVYLPSQEELETTFSNVSLRCILLLSLCDLVTSGCKLETRWLSFTVKCCETDENPIVFSHAFRFILLVSEERSLIRGIRAALRRDEDDDLIADLLRHRHWDQVNSGTGGSLVAKTLEVLMDDDNKEIREAAAYYLGTTAPYWFVDTIARRARAENWLAGDRHLGDYKSGMVAAAGVLSEVYFGSLCPGSLDFLLEEPEAKQAEYDRWGSVFETCCDLYHGQDYIGMLRDIANALRPDSAAEESQDVERYFCRNTLPLPFPDESS